MHNTKMLHMFFENKFEETEATLDKYKANSMLHAMELCYMSCCFMMVSMERVSVLIEKNLIKRCLISM